MSAGIAYPLLRTSARMCSRSEPLVRASPLPAIQVSTVEVHAAKRCVAWRIVRMVQFWSACHVAFELHPVQPLNPLLRVRVDERVQFTIGDPIENPPIRADVSNRFGQLDPHPGITC